MNAYWLLFMQTRTRGARACSLGQGGDVNRFLIRLLVVLTVILGVNYVGWRWLESLNWSAWWIAVPLVLAETYSLIDVLLFGMTMWRLRERAPITNRAQAFQHSVQLTWLVPG